MKVFWLLLFGVVTLPFCSCWRTRVYEDLDLTADCRGVGHENCLIEFQLIENEDYCTAEYTYEGSTTYMDRGCSVKSDRNGVCVCASNNCNSDITNFRDDLNRMARYNDDPKKKRLLDCLNAIVDRGCAVGDPQNMKYDKIESDHVCFVKLEIEGSGTYKVVRLGSAKKADENINAAVSTNNMESETHKETSQSTLSPFTLCEKENNFITCYCHTDNCNSGNNTFSERTEISGVENPQLIVATITSYMNGRKTCNHHTLLDEDGSKVSAMVFKKDQEGKCTSGMEFATSRQKGIGCFHIEMKGYTKPVACICEKESCKDSLENMNLLAALNMRLELTGCLHDDSTTLATSTTEKPTTTTTTKPEELTCLESENREVTEEKSNHVCFIDYHMTGKTCQVLNRGIEEQEDNSKTGCRFVDQTNNAVIQRCTCGYNKCNQQLDSDMWRYVKPNNSKHMELIDCIYRLIQGEDYMECAPGVFTRKTDGCQIKFEQKRMEGTGRGNEATCAAPEVTALYDQEKPWYTCQTDDSVTHCYCNTPNCIAGRERGGLTDYLKNVSWELYVNAKSLSCALHHYNLPIPQPSTTSSASTTSASSTVHIPKTLSTTASTPTTPLSSMVHFAKTSFFSGWHIGTIVFVGLLVVTILILVILLIKKAKGGEGKKEKAKEPQDLAQPTAIKIEKPAEKKDTPAATSQKGEKQDDKQETAVENTVSTAQENDSTISDSTGTDGYTGGDSQVRVSVRALQKH